jgi:hypothetical protein
MIAGASGGTNAINVSKNVQAWTAHGPSRRQFLLDASEPSDIRLALLRQPYVRHLLSILEGLFSQYRLGQSAFAKFCRGFVFAVSSARGAVRKFCTRSLYRLSLLDFLLRHSALVDG